MPKSKMQILTGAGNIPIDASDGSRGWHAIERNGSRLFVADSSLCQVEIHRLTATQNADNDSQTPGRAVTSFPPRIVSTVDDLASELKVT